MHAPNISCLLNIRKTSVLGVHRSSATYLQHNGPLARSMITASMEGALCHSIASAGDCVCVVFPAVTFVRPVTATSTSNWIYADEIQILRIGGEPLMHEQHQLVI